MNYKSIKLLGKLNTAKIGHLKRKKQSKKENVWTFNFIEMVMFHAALNLSETKFLVHKACTIALLAANKAFHSIFQLLFAHSWQKEAWEREALGVPRCT